MEEVDRGRRGTEHQRCEASIKKVTLNISKGYRQVGHSFPHKRGGKGTLAGTMVAVNPSIGGAENPWMVTKGPSVSSGRARGKTTNKKIGGLDLKSGTSG